MRIAVLGPLEVTDDDGATGRGARRQGAPAPGRPGRGRAGRRQHRPHRRGAVERRPAGRRTQVAAGPPGAPAHRPGAGPAAAARPGGTSSVGAAGYALAAGRRTSTPCGSPISPRAAGPGWPPETRPRLRGCSPTALDLWRGEPYGDWPDASVRRCGAAAPGRGPHRCGDRAAGGPARAGPVTPTSSRRPSGCSPRTRCRRSGGGCSSWRCTAPAGRATRSPRSRGRARCSPSSWAPIPDRGCARSRRPSSLRIPRWTSPSRRRAPVRRRTSRPARTRAWPRTKRPTPRCSTAGAGWSPGWWHGSSTRRCWWCRGPAAPGSPPSSGPGSCPRWPRGAPRQRGMACRRGHPGPPAGRRAGGTHRASRRPTAGPARRRPVRGTLGARRGPGGADRLPRHRPRPDRRRDRRPVRRGPARRPRRAAGRARGLHRAGRRRRWCSSHP